MFGNGMVARGKAMLLGGGLRWHDVLFCYGVVQQGHVASCSVLIKPSLAGWCNGKVILRMLRIVQSRTRDHG